MAKHPLYDLLATKEGVAKLTAKAIGQLPDPPFSQVVVDANIEPPTVTLRGWVLKKAGNGFPRHCATFWAILTPGTQGAVVDHVALYEEGALRAVIPMAVPVVVNMVEGAQAVPLEIIVGPSA